jgi:Trypsin-like peptidase domain
MGESADLGAVRPDGGESPDFDPLWRVRIRTGDGSGILGAGILVDDDRVLTCAHVVGGHGRVVADFTSVPGAPSVEAEAAEGCVVPDRVAGGDHSGDVALLRLAKPRPAGHRAVLHRVSPVGRDVTMYGYPPRFNGGIHFRAGLGGRCGLDGRVQMFPRTEGEVALPGFSGAGVVDEQTGRVIGMVVSSYDGGRLRLSFMIPTETILRHLPVLRPRASGETAVDRSALSVGGDADVDQPFAERLAVWLRESDWGSVRVTVVGADVPRAAALSRVIVLADRELAAEARPTTPAPPVSVPPVGSLDLAIDVRGRTVDDVATRVADRLGMPRLARMPARERLGGGELRLTIVVVGADRAADPMALLDFLDRLADRGSRLLLVFDAAYGPSLEQARARAAVRAGLTRLAGVLAEASDRGGQLHSKRELVVARTDAAKLALEQVGFIQGQVTGLRLPGGGVDARPLTAKVERFEEDARRALADLDRTIGRLTELIARRNELRGRLNALQGPRTGEDVEASVLYRAARDLLWQAPCDVREAEDAVRRYREYWRGKR